MLHVAGLAIGIATVMLIRREHPMPKHPDLFPSFPSQAAGERRHRALASPPPPAHVELADRADREDLMDLNSFV